MAKQKNLSLSALKKMNASLNTRERIYLDDNFYLDVDKKFRSTKIQLILQRILEVNQYMIDNKLESSFDLISYSIFLAIKNFTSLEVKDDIEVEVQALNYLIDLDYYQKIIDAFGKDNMEYFVNKLTESLKNVNYIQNQMIDEMFKNREVNEISESGENRVIDLSEQDGDDIALTSTTITDDTETNTKIN